MNLTQRGYCDRILHVDLGSGRSWTEPLPAEAMPLLLGGKGLGAYLLLRDLAPGVEPLSPDNELILHVGPLTGTTAPTSGRLGLTTKSPATGTISDSYCGGFFGQVLKYAGCDALVLHGAAAGPTVLSTTKGRPWR